MSALKEIHTNAAFEDNEGVNNIKAEPTENNTKQNRTAVAVTVDQEIEKNTTKKYPIEKFTKKEPSEDSDDEDDEDYSLMSFIPNYKEVKYQIKDFSEKYHLKKWIRRAIYVVMGILFLAYFIAVLRINSSIQMENYWCNGDGLLIILTLLTTIGVLYFNVSPFSVIKPFFDDVLSSDKFIKVKDLYKEYSSKRFVNIGIYVILGLFLIIFLLVDTSGDRERLVSLFGIFCILFMGFIFSAAPRKIIWRHVIWGLGLQFTMGLLILRWSTGRNIFKCMGDKVHTFLQFTDAGSEFVFGPLITGNLTFSSDVPQNIKNQITIDTVFAFKILSVVLFFSFCIQILYYYGIMQWIVIKLGWLLQISIGTTACESINASANIFLGQSEAPLLIKPYLNDMTKSELHAVLTGGFATVAGSVLAAFISFGVNATHLLSASVMSAPAALAFSKLFYPETKKTKTSAKNIKIVKGEESNVLHAAIVGVSNAIPLVANIAANLVAFISFIALFNSVFNWSCRLIDVEDGTCSLENLFGYMFMPLAWVMGVKWEECHYVGELIGLKTIVNEFVAYLRLAEMKKQKLLSFRAEIISTYALCGFSNISSIGIQLGALGAMAPKRKGDFSKLALRAMIAGSCACFLTACVAGTLIEEPPEYETGNSTLAEST